MHTGDQSLSGSMFKEGKREDNTGAGGGLGWSPVPGTTGENHSESPFSMYSGIDVRSGAGSGVGNDDDADGNLVIVDDSSNNDSDAAIGAAVCIHR